jgi:DNA replication and repair protein RecF
MAVASWDQELLAAGGEIDRLRAAYLETFRPDFEATSRELLGFCGTCHYRSGWPREMTLAEALEASWDRDRRYGQTHVGPHRAELTLEVDEVVARNRLSRGQQKLLGISLVLAQSEFVARQLDRDVVLLVDEPAAELDGERLEKLMEALSATRAQLFISALEREALPLRSGARVFHVERGEVTILL